MLSRHWHAQTFISTLEFDSTTECKYTIILPTCIASGDTCAKSRLRRIPLISFTEIGKGLRYFKMLFAIA